MAKEAYYNRVMSVDLVKLLTGEYDWLIDYVYRHEELEFQSRNTEFSLYRGTSKVFSLKTDGKVYAEESYKECFPSFYDNPTSKGLDTLLAKVDSNPDFDKYIRDKKGNYNEGYYQTLFGRRYTLDCQEKDEFILFDKEFQIGKAKYMNDYKKIGEWADETIRELKDGFVNGGLKAPTRISNNYTKCDYAGICRNGDLYLFEVKRTGNTNGIYTSPLQIGFYEKLVSKFKERNLVAFSNTIYEMLKQKQDLRLIKPAWNYSTRFNGNIKLAVIVGEDKISSTAQRGFDIAKRVVDQGIELLTCEADGTLKELKW